MKTEEIHSFTRGSRVFDLGMELYSGMPTHPRQGPYAYSLIRQHGELVRAHAVCAAVEAIFCTGHTGTHIDALCHFSRDLKLHGGIDVLSVQSKTGGIGAHGVETVAPLLRRGVLIDAAAHLKRDVLEPGRPIGREDLESAAAAQGVRVEAGDVVLVRTGHIHYWPGLEYYTHKDGVSGIDMGAAEWLADQGVYLVGSDTYCVEVRPETGLPVHPYMLVDKGIYLMEVANLEELSRTRTYEFLFICTPLKIRGGTGSPVRPLAVV